MSNSKRARTFDFITFGNLVDFADLFALNLGALDDFGVLGDLGALDDFGALDPLSDFVPRAFSATLRDYFLSRHPK